MVMDENTNPKIPTETNTGIKTGADIQSQGAEKDVPRATKPLTDAEKFSKKALRTYEGDVAEFMSHRRTSVASIAIAENAKREKEKGEIAQNDSVVATPEKNHGTKKILIVIVSFVFIIAGITGAYYLYSQSVLAPQTVIVQKSLKNISLIPSDSWVDITIDNLTPLQIISRVKSEISKSQSPNTLKEIILTGRNNEQSVRVNSVEMIKIMGIDAPDILARSLASSWMLGEYSDANGNKDVFIVATHNFFQNAFAGMLAWENVMADDLKQFFGSTQPDSRLSGHFTDGIIKNKDAREFRTETGNVLFLYSFIDNTKLIITSREATLVEIISRLEQQAFIR